MSRRGWRITLASLAACLLALIAWSTLGYSAPAAQTEADSSSEAAEATETPTPSKDAPRIVLAKNLRLVIRPTLLGLVPPEDAEGYGEAFVRIIDAGPGSVEVHYEIKELVDSTGGQASEWWQAPPEGAKPLTRIRRGEVSVDGMSSAHTMLSPLLWADGTFTTQSSLLWLSRACHDELATGGSTQFDGHSTAETPAPLAELLARLLAERRSQAGLAESAPLRLELVRRAGYPCAINGARLRLPALVAQDSAGLAEYWILDDADNPLVLKLSYLPSENTQNDPAPESMPAQAQTDPRRPRLKIGGSVYTPRGEAAGVEQAAAGPGGGLAALVHEGGGYAVTSIDF